MILTRRPGPARNFAPSWRAPANAWRKSWKNPPKRAASPPRKSGRQETPFMVAPASLTLKPNQPSPPPPSRIAATSAPRWLVPPPVWPTAGQPPQPRLLDHRASGGCHPRNLRPAPQTYYGSLVARRTNRPPIRPIRRIRPFRPSLNIEV